MVKTFTYTGGNDIISDYNGGDIIEISAEKISGYTFDGNDLIFKIGNGTLTLTDMKGRAITIKNSLGKVTTKVYGTGYTGQEVIKRLVAAWTKTKLTGIAKLDESIKLCSHYSGIQDVINHMVADCRKAGDADTFLKRYCGIILDNKDTGAITGWNAGGLRIKAGINIIPKTTTLEHLDDYTQASFVRGNVTINISSTDDNLTAKGKKVLDGLYNWWAEGAIKLIEKSYGIEFKAGEEINIELIPRANYWGKTLGNSVRINLGYTRFRNDDDYQGNGVRRIIAHEFTHIAQNLYMGRFPQFIKEGLADLTCGVEDRKNKKAYMQKLAGDADFLAKVLDLNNSGTLETASYAAGFMFYRYLAKQASDAYDKSISVSGDDFFTNTYNFDYSQDIRNSLADTELGKDFVDNVFANSLAGEFA